MSELECLVLEESRNIVSIMEVWWKGENQWDMVIFKCKFYRKDRKGVLKVVLLFMSKRSYEFNTLEIPKGKDSSTKSLWMVIPGFKSSLVLRMYYCAPNKNA